MTTTPTYTVYSMTLKGSFSQKYEGTNEAEAQAAYSKLEAKHLPRVLTEISGRIARTVQIGGNFPQ